MTGSGQSLALSSRGCICSSGAWSVFLCEMGLAGKPQKLRVGWFTSHSLLQIQSSVCPLCAVTPVSSAARSKSLGVEMLCLAHRELLLHSKCLLTAALARVC